MKSQIASLGAAKQNADSASDISSIAEGSLREQVLQQYQTTILQQVNDQPNLALGLIT